MYHIIHVTICNEIMQNILEISREKHAHFFNL